MWIQQSRINHIKDLKTLKLYGFRRLVHRTSEIVVLGFLEGPYSASSVDLTATKT